jgi:hypothetical protein
MTTTTLSTPRLSEVARHLVIPEGIVTSVYPKIEKRLNEAGVYFDLWQQGWGKVALGCRADGKFAASIGGVVASVPRQVGKTFTIGHLLIGLALEYPGIRAIWTSHHNRTTTNTFRSFQAMVGRKSIAPLLAPNGIRTANGEQEIRFTNGSIIMFGAREYGFGRGLDRIDMIVLDEAQILSIKALEDMVPAMNQARNPHGGLLVFIGTPPREADPGEVFSEKRHQALSGKAKNQVYIEISADEDADLDDESQYQKMNPSFPARTSMESMLRMRENLPDEDSYRREAMGIWPKVSHHVAVISPAVWRALKAVGPQADAAPVAFGVDMSHGLQISVAGSWLCGEKIHTEEVWAGDDVAAAVEWIAVAAKRRIPVLIDGYSPAAQMIPELSARGVKAKRTTAGDMTKGCLIFETRANAGTLSHSGQPQLAAAVSGARKRPIGDAGGWGWDRRDATVTIHPLVAATLALLSASSTRAPSDGKRISTRRGAVLL